MWIIQIQLDLTRFFHEISKNRRILLYLGLYNIFSNFIRISKNLQMVKELTNIFI